MTDYAAIIEQRDYERLVRNAGDIIAKGLYSDPTHFIYELLQNAEDARATYINFRLFHDQLEVRHNGRPFNESDVRAICDIGESTKDISKIGKFGIGFKSVYTHTTTPFIHSGDEHFCIENYVFPKKCPQVEIEVSDTLIIIPFNRSASDTIASYEHIAKKLPNLNSQTLLFLHSVEEIQWVIDNQQSGHYLRDTRETDIPLARWVEILDEQTNVETWIVFSAPVEYENYPLQVEIAFAIETDSKTKQLQVRKVDDAKLVAYFPTEKLTRFGFVMQGPYQTTSARDNVLQDHSFNQTLIARTADLIPEVAEGLKSLGLLDANALDAMMTVTVPPPSWEFQPVYDAIVRTFRIRSLLPTSSGNFIQGASAKLARGQELMELFTQRQLKQIFPSVQDVAWLNGSITESGRFAKLHTFLREQVKVDELTPAKMIELPTLPSFLRAQTDEWTIRFYTFLNEQSNLWKDEKRPLRLIPFIRLESGEHVPPFKANKEPNAYLPAEGRETAFPIVRKQIYADDEARRFLEQLGLGKPDLTAEVLELILLKYESEDVDVKEDEYIHDLEVMAQALIQANEKQRKNLHDRISRAYVILAQNAISAKLCHTTPNFAIARNGDYDFLYFDNPEAWYIHNDISENVVDIFQRYGLTHPGPIHARRPDRNNRVPITSMYGGHKRGLEGFDPDCNIDGLAHALQNVSVERASLIWNRLLIPYKHHIRGVVEKSTRQTFEGSRKEELTSPMGRLVRETAWLPDKHGQFHFPNELMLNDLPDEFSRDEALVAQLGMRPSAINLLAEQSGIDPELLKQISQISTDGQLKLLEELQNIPRASKQSDSNLETLSPNDGDLDSDEQPPLINYEDELSETFNRPGYDSLVSSPDELTPIRNPQRRIDKAKEQIAQAYREEPGSAMPSINHNAIEQAQYKSDQHNPNPPLTHSAFVSVPVVSKRRWEGKDPQTRTFLLQQYGGECQICGETFPRRRDGLAYFEGIYMVQRSKGRWIDRPGNVLCLCANHAAQFLHGSVEGHSFIDEVLSISHGASDYRPSIKLCGKSVQVRFTERHILDLKALVEFSRENLE